MSWDKSVASGFCGLSVSCAIGSLVAAGSLAFSLPAASVVSAEGVGDSEGVGSEVWVWVGRGVSDWDAVGVGSGEVPENAEKIGESRMTTPMAM